MINSIKEFKDRTDELLHSDKLGFTQEEIENLAKVAIEDVFADNNIENTSINDVVLSGKYSVGKEDKDDHIKLIVYLNSDLGEDKINELFNNTENKLTLNGIPIDTVFLTDKETEDLLDILKVEDRELEKIEYVDELEKASKEFPMDEAVDNKRSINLNINIDSDECNENNDEEEIENDVNEAESYSIINSLVNDEWEAINGYKGAVQFFKLNYDSENVENIISILESIIDEEMMHVGELQHALKLFNSETFDKIEDGVKEAEEESNDDDVEFDSKLELNDDEEFEFADDEDFELRDDEESEPIAELELEEPEDIVDESVGKNYREKVFVTKIGRDKDRNGQIVEVIGDERKGQVKVRFKDGKEI